jgi:YYY domain-containing protein
MRHGVYIEVIQCRRLLLCKMSCRVSSRHFCAVINRLHYQLYRALSAMQETFPTTGLTGSSPPITTPPVVRRRTLVLPRSRSDILVAFLLLLTMLLAGYFRYQGNNWDDFVRFHPDERFFTGDIASNIGRGFLSFTPFELDSEQRAACMEKYPDTGGVGGYFDARCSDMNPHNVGKGLFVYGTFPAFAMRWMAQLANQVTGSDQWTGYGSIQLIGRALSATYDLLAVLIVFFIGQKLHNKWVGLLAAILYACAVLPIQIAHFATADAMTTMWVALTLLFSVRILKEGAWYDYGIAGVAFGAALASRVNVAPLVVVILFAAGTRILPFFDQRLLWSERNRAFMKHFGGLVAAGVLTILVFRIFNPYAFVGPAFFGLSINERWLQDIGVAQNLTSAAYDGPPAWQWIGRPSYWFAWWNMVAWGMGLAFGLTAWVAWAWSGVQLVRARGDGVRNGLLFLWILVYFGWVGGNHVMSMRYYLPLYPAFAVLCAWMLVELIRRTSTHVEEYRQSTSTVVQRSGRRVLWRTLAVALTALVTVLTLLWAVMFTNIYRHMATFTEASHWVWENVPGDFSMQIDGTQPGLEPDSVPLINIALRNNDGVQNDMLSKATTLIPYAPVSYEFVAPASGTISSIYAPRIGSPIQEDTQASIQFRIEDAETGSILSENILTDTFPFRDQQVGDPYTISLTTPLQIEEGRRYRFSAQVVSPQEIVVGGSIMARDGGWEEVAPADVCALPYGVTLADNPSSGLVSSQDCNRLAALGSLVIGYDFNNEYEDHEQKRDQIETILNNTDYIIIASNRRYDSQSRVPLRWPMTTRYYESLFSGELGFELVATFEETFELGPLKISDQYLPTYTNSPGWLNELEAEEAFHVYDHPTSYIFKKRKDYSPEKTHEILYSVPLNRSEQVIPGYDSPDIIGTVPWSVETADEAPTQLLLTEDMQQVQYSNGTWSDRFDRNSLINTQPIVTILGWWLVVMAFGWAVFPILFVVTPGLADRGYAVAKFAGMLLIAWLGWYGASGRVVYWTPENLRLIWLGLTAIGILVVLANRKAFGSFLRERWRLILTIELITFVMFIGFLAVRLTNPDLWTAGFGGEKPMDYAYFNGVLRSTIFPPIDPWYATGYINYYYFGFVIAAVPTLVTGVIPAVAYNLILPTLFAAAGIGAFAAAFSIVFWLKERQHRDQPDGTIVAAVPNGISQMRLGNPYIAGIAALLMAMVLGNLDTPRTFLTGVAQAGGYTETSDYATYLIDQYRQETGTEPSGDVLTQLYQESLSPTILDSLRYQFAVAGNILSSISRGFGVIASGEGTLNISPDRWFWAPSRVITESVGGGAITEMPYFTFIYGDLHGHMIAMPVMLLIVVLLFNEIVLAGRERRGWVARGSGLLWIALPVALTNAVNTWDYPTFLALSTLGLGYAWWLNWRRISRWSLVSMILKMSTFFIVGYLIVLPYRTWYAATYSAVNIWDGTQTPLWAYLTIHGLFLFFIVSLLIWDTARWLRGTRVWSLRGRALWLAGGIGLALLIVAGSIIAAAGDYQVALIVVPLIAWIALLFFRPGQSVPMQYVLVLAGLGLALTLAVEIVVLAGDIGRQNTVFKFYIQVWLLFSVASGAALAWLLQSADQWRLPLKLAWYVPAGILLFVAAMFPIMATRGKAVYRLPPQNGLDQLGVTLDGSQFMRYTPAYYEGYPVAMNLDMDYQIIQWLLDNTEGSPVILEGISDGVLYKWGGRISIYTGLPSVVGWDWHQKQQRTFDPLPSLVAQRIANANNFYTTDDIEQAWRMLRHYDVSYVVVGSLENARYPTMGDLAKLQEMVNRGWLELVYETTATQPNPLDSNGQAQVAGKIYRVNKDAAPEIYIADVTTTDVSFDTGIGN